MTYEVEKDGARLWITVFEGICIEAKSPTHGCFDANFLGDDWAVVRKRFEDEGFRILTGT